MEAARHHKYQILLTGTPTPSRIADLWGQMRALDGGARLGRNITRFRSRYMVSDFMGITGTRALARWKG